MRAHRRFFAREALFLGALLLIALLGGCGTGYYEGDVYGPVYGGFAPVGPWYYGDPGFFEGGFYVPPPYDRAYDRTHYVRPPAPAPAAKPDDRREPGHPDQPRPEPRRPEPQHPGPRPPEPGRTEPVRPAPTPPAAHPIPSIPNRPRPQPAPAPAPVRSRPPPPSSDRDRRGH
jgi:hypothetical protein